MEAVFVVVEEDDEESVFDSLFVSVLVSDFAGAAAVVEDFDESRESVR